MKDAKIKLLIIEDSDEDVFFLVRKLQIGGFKLDYKQIESASELRSCLSIERWDLIITDHTLPDFSSIEAISIVKQAQPDLPLIVFSGTIDQSIAVESMRLGARDFIMKDDTTRLIPAIEREIEAARSRQQMRMTTDKLKIDMQGIMYHSPAYIFVKDISGAYTFVNAKAEALFHLENKQIIGKTDYDVFTQAEADQLLLIDKTIIKKGISVDAEIDINLVGGTRVFNLVKYPLIDVQGEIYAICCILTDITERKKQEEKIRRSQKMEAIGQLSGGVAHDFNNQLGVVSGYLELLSEHYVTDEKPRAWLDIATKSVIRCIDLTRQLLSFSRNHSSDKSVVNINAVINEISDVIERSLTPQVKLEFNLADDLWDVKIDAGEFQDVMLNFVINARDAMPDGGELSITTVNKRLDLSNKNNGLAIDPGDYVQLLIRDTGSGMSAEVKEHIFEPFYTTKPAGKGTGLGLSMIVDFVRRCNGDVSVYSEIDVGTTFYLYLPRSVALSALESVSADQLELSGGDEWILIVDDEPGLLELADIFLSDLGYRTCLAESPAQALEILSANEAIKLMFCDIVMPGGMNGYQLVKVALDLRPDMRILFTSGFDPHTMELGKQDEFNQPLLKKPYSKADLALAVKHALHAPEDEESLEN